MSAPAVSNVAGETPINIVRGTSLTPIGLLVSGLEPVLPTDPTPAATDLSPSGTYLLFMVKLYDVDPETGLPVPDAAALLTKDSRLGQVVIDAPATNGQVQINIVGNDTRSLDTYGNPMMPSGQTLRWSLKLFLGDGFGAVASEHIPLCGPWTVYDRSVQSS